MSTLDFVPRTLKRRKVELSSTLEVQTSNCTPKIQRTEETTTQTKSKNHVPKLRKRQIVEPSWDFAFLVWLALSDYSLWADGDLRRRMETNAAGRAGLLGENQIVSGDNMTIDEKESQNASDDQGYLPLDQLFKQSQVFYSVSEIQPYCDAKEIIYVNSLRQFAKDVIDVRFIVDPESSSTRTAVGSRRQRKPQSGYEVRRTDFASLKDSEFSRYSKSHWSALTVYMENIPIQYAKVPGIGKLIRELLPASAGSVSIKRVQNIVFPPHHQDLPGSIPICKGFALVTLSSQDDVQALLKFWPWDSKKPATDQEQGDITSEKKVDNQSAEETLAKTSGLRICTKARWEELRAEYLLYRQQLIEEINQYQDEEEARWQKETMDQQQEGSRKRISDASHTKSKQHDSTPRHEGVIHPDCPYPTGCLVLVRHVHLETNKTTLRTLFSRPWAGSHDAIDYIDYSKNMDSCYVRFGTPSHAEFFVDYFSNHHIAQMSALDGNGSESSDVKVIVPEIVLGKREEVYWEKIPEKLRRQAVEKTLKTIHGHEFVGGNAAALDISREDNGGGGRKRRRKGKASE